MFLTDLKHHPDALNALYVAITVNVSALKCERSRDPKL